MYISIHIPKTAGTTVAYILDYGLKRRILYDYKEDYGEAPPTEYLLRHRQFIDDHFDVIHGHFKYRKYASAFPDAAFITTLRDPVSRVVSQFDHMLNLDPDTAPWPGREVILGSMDIVQFASIPAVGNAQSSFLEGRDIADYAFILITEQLERSLAVFQKIYKFQRNDPYAGRGVPVINSKQLRSRRHEASEKELRKIHELTREDNELYRRGIARLEQLERQASS